MFVKGCGVLTASSRSEDHSCYTMMEFTPVESMTLSEDHMGIQLPVSSSHILTEKIQE